MEGNGSKRIDPRAVYRVVVSMLGIAFLGVVVLFGILLSDTWREYSAFEAREAAYRDRLAAINQERAGRETYLRKLLDDASFRDRVVRERLGYSREDEIIFKFED